jgi:hypothetical protein
MRIPQPKAPSRSMRATQPSTPPSNVRTTGPQGTPGGKARKPGVAGRRFVPGQEVYLWILVLVEIALIGGFRKYFRRFHGG